MSVRSWLIIMLVDISYTHSSDRLTYQPMHRRHSVNMLDDTPADMCATNRQNTLAECWFICAQHVYVGDKSKECQQRVSTNTRPNCAQSTQDPISLAQSSSMVVLVCFIMQRGLYWAAHEASQQGKLLN